MVMLSVRAVARECETYSEMIHDLAQLFDVEIKSEGRRHYLASSDLPLMRDLVRNRKERVVFTREDRARRKKLK